MGIQLEESQNMANSNLANSENIGEAAIVFIGIGAVLVVLSAASIIYGLHRRKRYCSINTGGISSLTEESTHNPTDFMKSLATWDRSYSVDEILEKRRRSVWTLEIFENYGSSQSKNNNDSHSET
ncbi:uncharacterized protein LOC118184383 [Stegodyphus dumicola]|uniref:uncharacterized protein LOC118184383 n=1 Tax=Stegodyphus dumicola TaxID=202533 RepID=UPI0015AE369F|nr:uncharacterized protein LOC118184383 [Stegodyphus dumicola]